MDSDPQKDNIPTLDSVKVSIARDLYLHLIQTLYPNLKPTVVQGVDDTTTHLQIVTAKVLTFSINARGKIRVSIPKCTPRDVFCVEGGQVRVCADAWYLANRWLVAEATFVQHHAILAEKGFTLERESAMHLPHG